MNSQPVRLTGLAGEALIYGADSVSSGGRADQASATHWLQRARQARLAYDPDVLETGEASDRGSEGMRSAIFTSIQEESERLLAEVTVELAPHRIAIEMLAKALMAADEQTLSGAALDAAIESALAHGG